MMYQETLQGNFNFSNDYDINYTYVDCPLITLEDGNSAGVIIAVCYSIIICISLPGNTFLLWVLLKQVGLSSSADCFLLHLTASDLIFTLTLVPWTINQIQGWIFGQSRITSRNHHHAVFNIFCIATCFFICWAPYNIFLFHISLRILGVTVLNQTEWDENIYCVTHVLAYSHCCLNPLIQIFGGRKFRNYLTWLRSFTRFSRRYSSYTFSNQSSFSGQTHL
ncbi:C-X-C chemokine receptor type 1-like isoform X3 [Myxocyprinus asiaticus]|uniref:C-X-C chemokine receptor type 1-like isoform X3 n=1 Tax=Myxocyprinus asiaticus TaxID=70543 RepID=UPI0022232B7D|nr:C-X-C chemokine receptor type 1-like isoform X3 [Myxocyprinus asiaticus]